MLNVIDVLVAAVLNCGNTPPSFMPLTSTMKTKESLRINNKSFSKSEAVNKAGDLCKTSSKTCVMNFLLVTVRL